MTFLDSLEVTTKFPTEKRCQDCQLTKPVSAFYRLRRGQEKRQQRCVPCDNRRRARDNSPREIVDVCPNIERDEDGVPVRIYL